MPGHRHTAERFEPAFAQVRELLERRALPQALRYAADLRVELHAHLARVRLEAQAVFERTGDPSRLCDALEAQRERLLVAMVELELALAREDRLTALALLAAVEREVAELFHLERTLQLPADGHGEVNAPLSSG